MRAGKRPVSLDSDQEGGVHGTLIVGPAAAFSSMVPALAGSHAFTVQIFRSSHPDVESYPRRAPIVNVFGSLSLTGFRTPGKTSQSHLPYLASRELSTLGSMPSPCNHPRYKVPAPRAGTQIHFRPPIHQPCPLKPPRPPRRGLLPPLRSVPQRTITAVCPVLLRRRRRRRHPAHACHCSGKRRNRPTQSCLNCHTSKRMVCLGTATTWGSSLILVFSVIVNDHADGAPSSAW